MFRVLFANGPGDRGSIPGRIILKTQKMVLDSALLNTQHFKVRIKGKMEQPWKFSSTLPLHPRVVAPEKRAVGSPSTKVTDFTYWCNKKKSNKQTNNKQSKNQTKQKTN